MSNNSGKEIQFRMHHFNLGLQLLDSSHPLDPNHRGQPQIDNNHLLAHSHNSLLGIDHLGSSSHSVQFTEGECSDT